MNFNLSFALASGVLAFILSSPASAGDFDYFKNQSCAELSKEMDALRKAETAINDSKKKAEKSANTQAVVTTLLVGWPFWGNVDHGDANNQLAEIRDDIKYVTRAQKTNKCI